MRQEHAPNGFAAAGTLAVGRAFVVFEVTSPAGASLVCKRARLAVSEHEEVHAQLLREGEILGRLDGRGAPRLVQAGTDERGPFVVMERVGAHPLAACRAGLAAAARAAFGALAAVHEAADADGPLGIVHHDLTPSNVLLSAALDRAWLVDFALARGRRWPAAAGGSFAGTIAFAAPELVRGEPAGVRADLFGLAAAIVSVALGREPRARGALDPAAQLVRAGEEPLGEFASAAPSPALAACLAFDPSRRPPSSRAVLDALSTW